MIDTDGGQASDWYKNSLGEKKWFKVAPNPDLGWTWFAGADCVFFGGTLPDFHIIRTTVHAPINPEIIPIHTAARINTTFDINKAVAWLKRNAHLDYAKAEGKCASFVRSTLVAGGLNTTGNPVPAREYLTFLPKLGFNSITTLVYNKGDIVAIHGCKGCGKSDENGIPYGHIQMFSGTQWISDFKQGGQFWPGRG